MKLRVFELAKKIGRKPEEVRDILQAQGKVTRSNLSLVDAASVEAIMAQVKNAKALAQEQGGKTHTVRATRGSTPSAVIKPKAPKRAKTPRVIKPEEKTPVPAAAGEVKRPKTAKQPKKPGQPKTADKPMPENKEAVPQAPRKPVVILERIDIPPAGSLPPAPVSRPTPQPKAQVPNATPSRATAVSEDKSKAKSGSAPKAAVSAIPQAARGQRATGQFPGRGRPKRQKKKGRRAKKEEEPIPEEKQDIAEMMMAGETRTIKVPEGVSVSELAEKIGVKGADLIKKLMLDHKMMATVNQKLDNQVAELLSADFNCEVEYEGLYGEEILAAEESDNPEHMVARAPVVTIMGHVDHGKTSLLDAIREADVASGESGGITQHIGAYKVKVPGHDSFPGGEVAFLDTPGHEAFSAMRARGAKATDVVVLVVAADDSVKPQTIEAINHAKDAEVPIVVAVNKIDKEGANVEKVKQDLAQYGLQPEDWGGKTQFAEVSAKQRTGITELLETLALETELLELKADPKRQAKGVIVEAKLDKGRGAVATVLVQKGTLRVGDIFVIGHHFGRVRALHDDHGEKITEAGPSTPVEILGLSGVPEAGDPFQVVKDEKLARLIASKRQSAKKERDQRGARVHLDDLFTQIEAGEVKELRLLIKADVAGSAEALKDTLEKIESEKIKAKVVHYGVGDITESDVNLATASNAIIIGFHVRAQGGAVDLAHREDVEIRLYKIIYEAVDEIRESMIGMLEPHYTEVSSGKGMVKQIFRIKTGIIAGTVVENGRVVHDGGVKVTRNGDLIWEGKIRTLKRFKEDAKEIKEGNECGIGLPLEVELEDGDRLEFTAMEAVAQKL